MGQTGKLFGHGDMISIFCEIKWQSVILMCGRFTIEQVCKIMYPQGTQALSYAHQLEARKEKV